MPCDPLRGERRSIRLPGYDYAQPGAYFVTICTHHGECLFDDPVLKRVAETMWQQIPRHFSQVAVDASVVMPNHAHGILFIMADVVGAKHSTAGPGQPIALPRIEDVLAMARDVDVGARHSTAGRGQGSALPEMEGVSAMMGAARNASPLPRGAPPGSLGAIIGNYKSVTARRINQIRHTPGMPVWQRNYYEHVIRSERALNAIRQYILDNPLRWDLDRYNPQATGPDPIAADLWRLLNEEAP